MEVGPLSRISPTTALPQRFQARYTDDKLPEVVLTIEVEGGVPVCTEITIRRQPGHSSLTAYELRQAPITAAIEHACRVAAMRKVEDEALEEGVEAWEPTGYDAPTAAQTAKEITRTRQRRKVTRSLLQDVARVYKAAENDGWPTKAVAEAFQVPRGTAARWVSEARKQHLIEGIQS